MNSIYDDIRAALETTLASIPNIPTIAWENVTFNPTTGTSFVKARFAPTVREPAVRGLNPQMYYQGVFVVDVYCPEGTGPSVADGVANSIIETLDATTSIYYEPSTDSILTESGAFLITESGGKVLLDGVIQVSIRYAERELGTQEGAFYRIPVVISWYIYN